MRKTCLALLPSIISDNALLHHYYHQYHHHHHLFLLLAGWNVPLPPSPTPPKCAPPPLPHPTEMCPSPPSTPQTALEFGFLALLPTHVPSVRGMVDDSIKRKSSRQKAGAADLRCDSHKKWNMKMVSLKTCVNVIQDCRTCSHVCGHGTDRGKKKRSRWTMFDCESHMRARGRDNWAKLPLS